ncbi:MAG: hypothetical protein JSR81_14700 [Proteobacteria bacterium]|nr:hypothetical protein [Pseudomonadota bacterium]
MSKWIIAVVAAASLAPCAAQASNAFDGTWKIDVNTAALSKKPIVLLLQNGMYDCKTCTPLIHVAADGADHPVSGSPYLDTVAIKVVNDHTMQEIDKKGGKVVTTSTTAVSPDGKMATYTFSDSSNTNGPPVTGKGISIRVAAAPAGANAISGSWRETKFENLSDSGAIITYKIAGDKQTMTQPTGQTYTAPLDGSSVAYSGAPGITTVEVKKLSAHTIRETDFRNGKAVDSSTSTVAADGKSMKITTHDLLAGRTTTVTATKQS